MIQTKTTRSTLADSIKVSTTSKTIEKRPLLPFTTIEAQLNATIFLAQGYALSVTVEAATADLPLIETHVENNTLVISTNDKLSFYSPKIYICTNQIDRLKIGGNCAIKSMNLITGKTLAIQQASAADIQLQVLIDFLELQLSGSGNIFLKGQAQELTAKLEGASSLNAFGCDIQSANIIHFGSGKAEIKVNDKLQAIIGGSGEIAYKGYPVIEFQTKGIGIINNKN